MAPPPSAVLDPNNPFGIGMKMARNCQCGTHNVRMLQECAQRNHWSVRPRLVSSSTHNWIRRSPKCITNVSPCWNYVLVHLPHCRWRQTSLAQVIIPCQQWASPNAQLPKITGRRFSLDDLDSDGVLHPPIRSSDWLSAARIPCPFPQHPRFPLSNDKYSQEVLDTVWQLRHQSLKGRRCSAGAAMIPPLSVPDSQSCVDWAITLSWLNLLCFGKPPAIMLPLLYP